jgi:DNA-binding NarL/FixJ family response regulator
LKAGLDAAPRCRDNGRPPNAAPRAGDGRRKGNGGKPKRGTPAGRQKTLRKAVPAASGQDSRATPAGEGGMGVTESAAFHFVIADDHPLFRGALRQTIENLYPGAAISEVGTLEDAAAALEGSDEVDLLFLDLSMPGMRGFAGLIYLRAQYPGVPVVMVSASEDAPTVRRCMELGAAGFIPKSRGIEVIRAGIAATMAGNAWTPPDMLLGVDDDETAAMVQRMASLTPQQVRVLMMLSEGLLNKQIAYELSVSEATVKAHVSAILQKLGVESRTQAVIAAARIEQGHWQAAVPIG